MPRAESASDPGLSAQSHHPSLTTVTDEIANDSSQTPLQAYKHVIEQFKHAVKHISDLPVIAPKLEHAPTPALVPGQEEEVHQRYQAQTSTETNEFLSSKTSDASPQIDWVKVLPYRFPGTPSALFLKMYAEAVKAVVKEPKSAVLSPSLLSSSGKVTLTIVSVIPDIMRYHHDAIISAKSEVLLATNSWEIGPSVSQISSALVELNRRAGEAHRRIQVKILMDAPSIRNALQTRFHKNPASWPKIGLPAADEIPHLTMEVLNYHIAPLGTFHSKFAIIDRKFGLLCSNNVNLRCNLEMMVKLEGEIVNSMYDTFLISWCENLHEPLHYGEQVVEDDGGAAPVHSNSSEAHLSHQEHGHAKGSAKAPMDDRGGGSQQELFEKFQKLNAEFNAGTLNKHLNVCESAPQSVSPDEHLEEYTPFFHHYSSYQEQEQAEPVPMCLVNRPPYRLPGHGDVVNPQNNVWLAAFAHAQHHVFVQSPVFNAKPLMDAVIDACKRDVLVELWIDLGFNDFAEGYIPFQGGTNEQFADKLFKELIPHNKDMNLHYHFYVAKDQTSPHRFEDFTRNCHIKFMAVDQQVCVVGSGNMDTQSWFHSQEVNVMVDSQALAKQWREHVFKKNQNTYQYGRIDGRKTSTLLHSGEALPLKSKGGGISRAQGGFL